MKTKVPKCFIIIYCKFSPIWFNLNIWFRRTFHKCFEHEK